MLKSIRKSIGKKIYLVLIFLGLIMAATCISNSSALNKMSSYDDMITDSVEHITEAAKSQDIDTIQALQGDTEKNLDQIRIKIDGTKI